MIALCKSGTERYLAAELAAEGCDPTAPGGCTVRWQGNRAPEDLCFASATLLQEQRLPAAGAVTCLTDWYCRRLKGRRVDAAWPLLAWRQSQGELKQVAALEQGVLKRLRPAMSRVARLAVHQQPGAGISQGLFAIAGNPDGVLVSDEALFYGQRRMRDDPAAPSRSYLKVEEAYRVLGTEPQAGQSVADLGAAPGGWSYSAAKRGASVDAVDNGALKAAAADHSGIAHLREDGFTFRPERGRRYDWLFCDMVEDPRRVLALVEKWVGSAWCQKFVVNIKLGRTDPVPLVLDLKRPDHPLRRLCRRFALRQLYHDRDEVTLMGILA